MYIYALKMGKIKTHPSLVSFNKKEYTQINVCKSHFSLQFRVYIFQNINHQPHSFILKSQSFPIFFIYAAHKIRIPRKNILKKKRTHMHTQFLCIRTIIQYNVLGNFISDQKQCISKVVWGYEMHFSRHFQQIHKINTFFFHPV